MYVRMRCQFYEPHSCPASPTSAANVELRFSRILLSFSIDNFHSVNTVLVGDDTTLHLQLTRGLFSKKVRTYRCNVWWWTKRTTPIGSISGSANQNYCIGPNLKARTYRHSVSCQASRTSQFGSVSSLPNQNCCIGPNPVFESNDYFWKHWLWKPSFHVLLTLMGESWGESWAVWWGKSGLL